MGKELIALLVILLMTGIYSFNDSGIASKRINYEDPPQNFSYIEIVRDGLGRIYPLNEVRQKFIITKGKALNSGDLLEFTSTEIRRVRMNGHSLLLFGMPINLNLANADDLTALSGIGNKTAKAIVKFREENGPFKTISELMRVRGIGSKKLEKIKDKLTI